MSTVEQSSDRTPQAARSGLAAAVRDIASELSVVRTALQTTDPEASHRLEVADEELRVLGEEVGAQLAELETVLAARRQEALLTRRLVATLPVPLVSTDVNGSIQEANAAAARLVGVPADRLVRKPLVSFLDAASRRAARSLVAGAVGTRRGVDAVLVAAPRGGGASMPCRVTVVPVVVEAAGFTHGSDPAPVVESLRWVLDPAEDVRGERIPVPGDEAARRALVELCRLGVGGEADLRALLHRVVQLTCEAVPGVVAASVTLGQPDEPELVVSSSIAAQAGDGAQHRAGFGPTFDAFMGRRTATSADVFAGDRAPADPAGHHPVGGGVAMPLTLAGATVGVLTLYAATPGVPRTEVVVPAARPYVVAAETLIQDSRLVAELMTVRDQLRTALTSRAVIDQAKGVVMAKHRCTADEAFRLLTRMSNSGNRKLRDIAVEIVEHAGGAPVARARDVR